MKNLLILFSFLFFGFAFGQNIQHTESIQGNFSTKNILAYQNSSKGMIEEFYEYLTMYSNEKNAELLQQIKSNIEVLVHSNEIELNSIHANSSSKLKLTEFLQEIKEKNITFQPKKIETSSSIGTNHWTNSYQLEITEKGKKIEKSITQIIQFQPVEKKFGTNSKVVWSIKLGSVQ